jgi:hypothetical protein
MSHRSTCVGTPLGAQPHWWRFVRRCFVGWFRLDFGKLGQITEHCVTARTVRMPFYQVAMRRHIMQASVLVEHWLVTHRTIAMGRRFDSQA